MPWLRGRRCRRRSEGFKERRYYEEIYKRAVTIFLAGAMVLSLASCRSTNKESQSVEKDSAANDGNGTDASSAAENKVFRLGVNGSNETGFLQWQVDQSLMKQ